MNTKFFILFLSFLFFVACQNKNSGTVQENQVTKKERKDNEMKIVSSTFKDGDMMPARYTCDDENISPQLSWTDASSGTKSFALICDDPDAPAGDWVHWVIFNIPPTVSELQENVKKDKTLSNGATQGLNDFGKSGYDGPCPPGGTHRYFFKLFSLDNMLEKDAGITKALLLKLMEGHILGEAQIVGKYRRQ